MEKRHHHCLPEVTLTLFRLDFGQEHTKAHELVNARVCQEIIVFSN